MPSGPKKRKAAKKKLQQNPSINETILTADTQDSSNFAKQQEASEKTQSSSIDHVNTTNSSPEIDSNITNGTEVCVVEDNNSTSVVDDQEISELNIENSVAIDNVDDDDDESAVILSGKLKRAEQLERLKKSLVEELQEVDKWTSFLHKLLHDINNFQLSTTHSD